MAADVAACVVLTWSGDPLAGVFPPFAHPPRPFTSFPFMSSSTFALYTQMDGGRCFCGYPSVLRTSWTDSNPGRRFRGCSRFGTVHGCGFFMWIDPPMCARAVQIIPGLLRRIAILEEQRNNRREKWVWILLFLSWLIIWLMLCNSPNLNDKALGQG